LGVRVWGFGFWGLGIAMWALEFGVFEFRVERYGFGFSSLGLICEGLVLRI